MSDGSLPAAPRSPYLSAGRYEHPKEDFKHVGAVLGELYGADSALEAADVGCANGELLYYLKGRFPRWTLIGYDREPAFLDTGRAFPGLEGVSLREADLYDIEGRYDVVLATCFLPRFREFEPPLEKLLSLCLEGGHLLVTGLFNPYDIDVRVQYLDHSAPEAGWIDDSNRHSRRRVGEWLAPRCRSVEFRECRYDVELAHDPGNPARVWTFRDAAGETLLINGAWQIANQTLMVVAK